MEVGLPLMALGHPVMAQPGLAFGVSVRPSDTSATPGAPGGRSFTQESEQRTTWFWHCFPISNFTVRWNFYGNSLSPGPRIS